MGYRSRYSQWQPYVSVAERKRKAEKHAQSLKKKGTTLQPIAIEGRTIAKTFWGKAWCENLESYSDYENRLPRGRTYVRNGSVIDLQIEKGTIKAQVMGSSLYHVEICIQPMELDKWQQLVKTCGGKIDSVIELLQGKFSKAVMEILTENENGLFPKPKEIKMSCSCPDHAGMCKHIAATLYGVGALLDGKPENLFVLRHVEPTDLIASAETISPLSQPQEGGIEESELASIFGIEMEAQPTPKKTPSPKKKTAKKPTTRNTKRTSDVTATKSVNKKRR